MAGTRPTRGNRRNGADTNRRDALLRVCAKPLRKKGFDATTIRDISTAAGMHSGNPFYHFKSEQDMLVSVMEQGLGEGLRKTEAMMGKTGPKEPIAARCLRSLLDGFIDTGGRILNLPLYE